MAILNWILDCRTLPWISFAAPVRCGGVRGSDRVGELVGDATVVLLDRRNIVVLQGLLRLRNSLRWRSAWSMSRYTRLSSPLLVAVL